jgi:hypothetical protein
MPAYANTFPPSSLEAGAVQNVWATGDGNLASGTKTQRAALVQRPGGEPIKVAFRCAFGGAPGVIALQLQTSDTDVDTDYVNEGVAISTVNASNVARGEFPSVAAKFARLLATTVTNAVTATVDLAS